MAKKPTKAELEKLAHIALRAEIKAKAADAELKKAKAELIGALMDANMFNPDTHALGDAKLKITPNRYFDVETALTFVTPKDVEESTVPVIDATLLKAHMTGIQIEKAMKSYEVPFKLGLSPNVREEA